MNDSLEDIIAAARDLGKKISAHPRTAAFLAAAKAVSEDSEAQSLLKSYQEAVSRIHTLESQGRPVEPEDKRRAADAERKLAGNDKLKAMMKQQADYLEMMHRVNTAIDESVPGGG